MVYAGIQADPLVARAGALLEEATTAARSTRPIVGFQGAPVGGHNGITEMEILIQQLVNSLSVASVTILIGMGIGAIVVRELTVKGIDSIGKFCERGGSRSPRVGHDQQVR